jgi:hypothetical protein
MAWVGDPVKLIRCTRCGGGELLQESGYVICTYCRSRFLPEPDDILQAESVIDVNSDILALLQKCEEDPANRRRYASLILDIDPTNRAAMEYLG